MKPLVIRNAYKDLRDRFDCRVERIPGVDCWIWNGSTNKNGYGMVYFNQQQRSTAHRVSYSLYVGPVPRGQYVLHKCDVHSCVNPDHLFAGTPLDNMRDMINKGRNVNPCGEKAPRAKLTEKQVLAILRDNRGNTVVAKDYGVCDVTICDIRKGRTWRHLS